MAHLAFLIGAGLNVGIVDPFATRRMSAARLHPRRDDEGHDNGNSVDDATGDDTGADDDGASDDDKSKDDTDDTKSKDETDWKAMARKHEREAKANRAAAAELEKIRDKNRTAEEKAAKAAQDAIERAEKAEARAARSDAARKYNLADEDLDLLLKVPADEVDAFAKRLSKSAAPAGASGREATGGKKSAKPTTLSGAIGAHYA